MRTALIARDSRLRALRRRRLRHSVGSGRCGRHVNERLATGDSKQDTAGGVEPSVFVGYVRVEAETAQLSWQMMIIA